MVAEEHLESIKYTDKAQFILWVQDWLALRQDADRLGRVPRMVVDFEQHGVRLVITEEPL